MQACNLWHFYNYRRSLALLKVGFLAISNERSSLGAAIA